MFPTSMAIFSDFGGIGVSMFFVSTLVSQLVYTGGASIFKGGNGSMMIEVVVRSFLSRRNFRYPLLIWRIYSPSFTR